ncbi:MAG: isoprenylcysteine carboxylmethyltransferase family protein [Saprospiraceae bacterium]|mgnify:CR=1 FL=1|nr:isoprenylcysteine carboxylmethyltransferase family protein [Bacteroidota bacterium]MCB0673536.1 isoprenylcysteine carboxylmethyltransferase family protein [Saprospiraceae bacterium]
MYLFIFLIIYFFLVFFLRSYLLWKKTKINPLTFNKRDDAQGYNGKVFAFISLLELIVVSINAFVPFWLKYLLPFWYLEFNVLKYVGWGLLFLSLIVVWLAQSDMRDSWRIGIDEDHKSELITNGFFTLSRNPVFLGIMIANVGLFLVLPNAFTLLIVALSTLSINTQIRLEEDFLLKEFGDKYLNYRRTVNRWIKLNRK